MGASESQLKDVEADYWRREAQRRLVFNNNNIGTRSKNSTKSGKPFPPPGKPSASDITHNSLVLTWNQPKHDGNILAYTVEMCHITDNRWLVLTYSCQGCLYQVRNLQPDQIYKFRLRVENIYGTSKPSQESDPVQTQTSDVGMKYDHVDSDTKVKSKPVRRRHSFNVPLEGTVVTILNHSDTVVKSSTNQKAVNSGTRSAESTFQRSCFRTSLEPCRKRSLASLLPGSKTDSVSKMRDSYRKSNHSRSSLFTMQGISRSNNNSRSDISNSANTSRSDISIVTDISKSDMSSADKRFSNTSDSQTSSSGVDETDHLTDNESCDIWERKDEDYMKTSLSDEINLAFASVPSYETSYNRNNSEHLNQWNNRSEMTNGTRSQSPYGDLRSLRHLLHSSDIIMKPNPMDYIEYNSNASHLCHKLSTISDTDEEECIKVTTL